MHYSMILIGLVSVLPVGLGCGTVAEVPSVSEGPIEPPMLSVVAVSAVAPRVTAEANDPAWEAATQIPSLLLALGLAPEPGDVSTRVRLCWDAAHIYVRFEADDRELYAPVRGRDKELYRGDVVEVFLDPVGDGKQVIEVQVSPHNDVFDQVILLTADAESNTNARLKQDVLSRDFWAFPSWNCDGLRTAASFGADGSWIVDIAIPATSVLRRTGKTTFSDGLALRANFIRYDWVPENDTRTLRAFNWLPVVHGCPHISPRAMGALRLVQTLATAPQ